jgi:DNA polymerase-4
VTEISKACFKEKIFPLPCGNLFGVGRSTEEKLKRHGIYTIGDLAEADDGFIRGIFGKNGATILAYARGYDDMPVALESYKPICKSISHGCTSAFDLKTPEDAELLIMELSDMVGEKLREGCFAAHKVQICVKDNKLAEAGFSESYAFPIISAKQIKSAAMKLFSQKYNFANPVRAISVGVGDLEREELPYQLDFYTDYGMLERDVAKEKVAEEIRRRLGKRAIVRGSLLKTTFARSNAIYEFNPFQNNFVR